MAREVGRHWGNVIGGVTASAAGGEVRSIVDPVRGEAYATATDSDSAEVARACAAAGAAFASWRLTTPADRSRQLLASKIRPAPDSVVFASAENPPCSGRM